MNSPKFPEDFRVLYAEGASYWFWSPFADASYDGTKSVDDPTPWPAHLMVGHEDSTSHEFVAGEPAIVVWMTEDLDPVEQASGTYDPLDPTCVQRLVDHVLALVGVSKDTVPSLP